METQISPYRRLLLGQDCQIVGLRASYPTANGIASKATAVYLPGNPGQQSASQNDSLATVFYDSTSTRKKIVHLRGPWDLVVGNESYHPDNDLTGAWSTYFASWVNQLIASGYGWLGKNPAISPYGVVLNYTQNINDTINFQLQVNPTTPLPAAGTIVSVRFSKINGSKSILNRTILCSVSDASTLTSISPIGVGPFTAKGKFSVSFTQFLGYNSLGSVTLGERRMGKVLGRYPGRARRRPVY
jgi:hypothetical protein